MVTAISDSWMDRVERALNGYSEELLRGVAHALYKPRNQWPRPELVKRALETLRNPAVVDRRLRELSPGARQTLRLMAHSRQPIWHVGGLVEMLVALGQADGLAPVLELLQGGLLYPQLEDLEDNTGKKRLRHFDGWLGQTLVPQTFAFPLVLQRSLGQDMDLPPCPGAVELINPVAQEADGLDWPLRLAILWQQTFGGALRRTQSGDFFKRDLDRLKSDPLLNAPSPDSLIDLPDLGLAVVALALASGVLREHNGEVKTAGFDRCWEDDLPSLLADLWANLPKLAGWNPQRGWQMGGISGNPFPSAYLLLLVLLAQLPAADWARPEAIAAWVEARHPFWAPLGDETPARRQADDPGLVRFLLGVAYPLKLLQAAKHPDGGFVVRLSALGRWLLCLNDHKPVGETFPQTLLVQPNLEILAYRQGLTPPLLVQLTRFATWKTLGAACTLQLEPASVYRALESGESFEDIVQTLERRGMKAVPPAVLDALRTWSNKRDRLTIWSSAALFEFPGPDELTEALARGLPATRLNDRLAVVASEDQIDYRHFRLTGTRDYCLPPERCVEVDGDGVTLSIDLARSDLLLESEVHRFAEPSTAPARPGRRLYQLTPASIALGRLAGLTLPILETWFIQRAGMPLSPSARLFFTAHDAPPVELRRQLVLHLANPDLADGLMQWPLTRVLIQSRLGPAALTIAERDAPALDEYLKMLGLKLFHGEG